MTKDEILKDLYTRFMGRKFLTFVVISLALLADNFGWFVLDESTRRELITLAISFLVVQGGVDSIKAYKKGDSV